MHNKLATADVSANVLKLEEVAVLPPQSGTRWCLLANISHYTLIQRVL